MTAVLFVAQANAAALSIGPFLLLLLALPVLLFGEVLTRKINWLLRSNVPPPIIGGLLIALLLLIAAEFFPGLVSLQGNTANPVWLWSVLPQWHFTAPRPTDVERPLLILFFTCIGLNASWRIARQGGIPLVIYLTLAAGIAALQAVSGAATAIMLGENPLLGVMCSNVSLMGGFGTAAGFAPEFEKAGLVGAATVGVAAAAFGVIAGGVVAGLVAGQLIETKLRRGAVDASHLAVESAAASPAPGFIGELRELISAGGSTLLHLLVLFLCMKIGAFVSAWIQGTGITFPVYMGSMLVAAAVRNANDLLGGTWLKEDSHGVRAAFECGPSDRAESPLARMSSS